MRKIIVIASAALALAGCSDTVSSPEPTSTPSGVSYIEVFLDPVGPQPVDPPGSHPVGTNPLDVIAGR